MLRRKLQRPVRVGFTSLQRDVLLGHRSAPLWQQWQLQRLRPERLLQRRVLHQEHLLSQQLRHHERRLWRHGELRQLQWGGGVQQQHVLYPKHVLGQLQRPVRHVQQRLRRHDLLHVRSRSLLH